MDLKKSKQASLENMRGTYFIIGLIISCSLILISFEWTTITDLKSGFESIENLEIDFRAYTGYPKGRIPHKTQY